MNLREYVSQLQGLKKSTDISSRRLELTDALHEQLQGALDSNDMLEICTTLDELDDPLHYSFYYNNNEEELSAKIAQVKSDRRAVTQGLKKIDITTTRERENRGAYVFLHSMGLLDNYLELARALSFEPDMSSARHFYYAQRLKETLIALEFDQARVLEIGAGAGNLMMILQHFDLVKDYTIIDLPEMLLLSGANIENRTGYKCDYNEAPPAQARRGVCYLLPSTMDTGLLRRDSFDLVLNFNSFSEMPPSVVEGYFKAIYRTAKKGALFMDVNRVQSHDQGNGGVYETNPLLFPYDRNDQVLEWNIDPFQQFVRQFARTKPVKTTAIMRTARVGQEY